MELRFANIFILGFGAFFALKEYFTRNSTRYTNYLDGLLIGLGMSILSGLLVGISMLGFLDFARPDIAQIIQAQLSFGKLPIEALPLVTLMEAIFSGIMVSFLSMQLFKNFNRVGHKFDTPE